MIYFINIIIVYTPMQICLFCHSEALADESHGYGNSIIFISQIKQLLQNVNTTLQLPKAQS